MNKLLLLALASLAFIALSGAEEHESEGGVLQVAPQAQLAESRIVRDADPAKNNKAKKARKGKKNGKGVKKNKKAGKAKKNRDKKGKKSKRKGKKNRRKGKRTGKKLRKKGKKGRKSKKNKKRKGNKKAKGKKGKKSNKRRKSKKSKKNKKNKKSKKVKSSASGKSNGQQKCGRAVSDDCLDKAVKYMKILKDKVGNFQRQFSRTSKQNSTGNKKSGKKDAFKGALTRLIESGGGNATSLSCGGSTTNAGAKQLNNLTSTLKKCSDDIKKACDPSNLPKPNISEANACNASMTKFETKVEECRKKSGDEACTCWTNTELETTEKSVKKCTLSKHATDMAKAIDKCRKAFSKCRKYEDDVGSVIHSCAVSSKTLKAKLKSLKKNKAEMTKLKDKITSLSKTAKRAARALTTCTAVVTTTKLCITYVTQNPASTLIFKQASLVTSVTTVTCTTSEKSQLTTLIVQVTAAILSIERETAAVQSTLNELTGATASSTDIDSAEDCVTSDCNIIDEDGDSSSSSSSNSPSLTTPGTVLTTVPSKRRRQAVEDILKSRLV